MLTLSFLFKLYKMNKSNSGLGFNIPAFSVLTFILLMCVIILNCTSTKNLNEETTILGTDQKSEQFIGSDSTTATTTTKDLDLDEHFGIWQKSEGIPPLIFDSSDSLTQIVKIYEESEISSQDILVKEFATPNYLEIKSAVADKIVENYENSKNKEPGGHCLAVSKRRFEKAYEDVLGHKVYKDLPNSMATTYYTPREVFDHLYDSASGTHNGWRSLPKEYRGKGSAGAIAYAGMGTLVDWFGIWNGKLRPGAMMQVWRLRKDYEEVIRGVSNKNFDPLGHSFIFIGYDRNEKNEIIGIRIADQGFQSYRSLVPSDYEVWWAVNLTIQ